MEIQRQDRGFIRGTDSYNDGGRKVSQVGSASWRPKGTDRLTQSNSKDIRIREADGVECLSFRPKQSPENPGAQVIELQFLIFKGKKGTEFHKRRKRGRERG
jgi:hypothetical protein